MVQKKSKPPPLFHSKLNVFKSQVWSFRVKLLLPLQMAKFRLKELAKAKAPAKVYINRCLPSQIMWFNPITNNSGVNNPVTVTLI